MRGIQRAATCIALGLFTGCATTAPGGAGVADCPPLAELPPRATSEVCADAVLADAQARLGARVGDTGGPLLVRVEHDGSGAPSDLCVEPANAPDAWRARSRLAERRDAILARPEPVACLAGRRLDLNRYGAKLAEIRERERHCQARVDTHRRTGSTLAGRDLEREYRRCLEVEADWILLHRGMEPVVFVPPEASEGSPPSRAGTLRRCRPPLGGVEAQMRCVEAEGWERLEPLPPLDPGAR